MNFGGPRKPFLWLALAAVAGIALAAWFPQPTLPLFGACAVLALVLLRWPQPVVAVIFTGLAFYTIHAERTAGDPAAHFAQALPPSGQMAQAAGVVWSEPDAYIGSRGEPLATFRLRIESLDLAAGLSECLVHWKGAAPAYGDRVEIRGPAQRIPGPGNPGQFDQARWLARQGVAFELHAGNRNDCKITGHDEGSRVERFAIAARAWVKSRLEAGIGDAPEIVALIESMVLGLRGDTPPEMKGLFQRTGTLHLFAVSGLNVAMLAAIAWYLLKPFVKRRFAVWLILPLLVAYAIVTGLGASCVRATIMGGLLLLAFVFDRQAVPLNSVAAAAVLILMWDTNEIFSPGFQFSFVLVLVILGFANRLAARIEPAGRPDAFIPDSLWTRRQRWKFGLWRAFAGTIGVTLSAWLGSLIFTAGYFNLFSVASILANFLAVPLAFLILTLGVGSLLCPPAAVIFNHANWGCAKALLGALELCSQIPGGYRYVETPRWKPAPACEVTVLDVGSGGATHLRAGGRDWLLDTGAARDYRQVLLPYLRSRGINSLAGLVLTHGDAAHLSGAVPLLDDAPPAWIAEPPLIDRSPVHRALHTELVHRAFGRRLVQRGDVLTLAPGVELRVLFPPPDWQRSRADDKTLVVRLEMVGSRVLFTSDAGFMTERWLLENEPDLAADVLVKGWHEKDFSGTPDFIAAVNPRLIVATEGAFGTPDANGEKWAAPFRTSDRAVWLQGATGAATIELPGAGAISARAFRDGQTFSSRAR
jgi:ComEC/Rec2-related protein